jgi:hypothetical protein
VKKDADETGVRVGVKGKASDGDEVWIRIACPQTSVIYDISQGQ